MPGDWTFYMAAVPAVVLLGLSKGGFSGLSTLAMPLLALAISPVRAAAIVLPILLVQDWVSVWAFRRDFNVRNLLILIPAALIGIAAGWLLAARVSEAAVRLAVGLISVGFVVFMLLRDRLAGAAAAPANVAPGIVWGALAGFTSFVSHAGAPPVMVYVMPQKLAPRVFAGTLTMFFAAVNLLKVPPYFLLGQFSADNLTVSASLFPLAIAATFAGVWLVRRVSADRFYAIVLVLTFLIGVKLSYDGLREILV
ncbi:MAG: sulfite exporter TauE/SafE family protein [Roseiarcus sp.]